MHNLLSMIAEGTKREIESVCERDTGRERLPYAHGRVAIHSYLVEE